MEKNKVVELISQEVEKLIKSQQANLQDVKRFAIDEAWKILQIFTAVVIQIIEAIGGDLSGKDKKELAMTYISKFYDITFLIIDIPMVPSVLESFIHKYTKSLLLLLVSASIDALVTTFRNTGIFLKKKVEG